MMEEDKLFLWLTYQYVSYSTWRGASEENPEPPSRWQFRLSTSSRNYATLSAEPS